MSSDRLTAAMAELVEALREEIRADAEEQATSDRLLSIPEAADLAGIGRTMLYQEIMAGRLRSIRVGRRRLIPSAALRSFIADSTRSTRAS